MAARGLKKGECPDNFFDIYRYRNNVTRPGMVYRRSVRELLADNYEEIDGLIRYICENMGGVDHVDEFRQYYFEKYLKGVGNYKPYLGCMAKFFHRSVYFKYQHFLKDLEPPSRQVPVGLEVGDGVCSFEGEVDSRDEYGVLCGKLRASGHGEAIRVVGLLREGYKLAEVVERLGYSWHWVTRLMRVIKSCYMMVREGV
jgi:hypothetical protein